MPTCENSLVFFNLQCQLVDNRLFAKRLKSNSCRSRVILRRKNAFGIRKNKKSFDIMEKGTLGFHVAKIRTTVANHLKKVVKKLRRFKIIIQFVSESLHILKLFYKVKHCSKLFQRVSVNSRLNVALRNG